MQIASLLETKCQIKQQIVIVKQNVNGSDMQQRCKSKEKVFIHPQFKPIC